MVVRNSKVNIFLQFMVMVTTPPDICMGESASSQKKPASCLLAVGEVFVECVNIGESQG
jgi:hypothetical protein